MDDGAIGKFQILDTLGTGAHSTILHIRRSSDSKQYALKLVPITGKEDHKFLIQAEHEFRIAQKLSHPNLLRIYKIEEQKDWLRRVRKVQLLIEFVNGATLDNVRGLSITQMAQVFEFVADAMVHMHRRHVFHADLKPSNILLSKTGQVKVFDYGLAWMEGQSKHRIQGTPEYMAPEQAQHQMVNARTDIYNLGATMYRMLTFQHPPPCLTAPGDVPMDAKMYHNLLKPVQELNANVPDKLCALVHDCLQFKARKRPERMSEIQGALDHLVEDLVQGPEDRLEALEW